MTDQRSDRRTLQGIVLSAKAAQTVTVEVERTYKHRRYGKYLRKKKKYMAHDAAGVAHEGDIVEIAATRPISKRKRWRVVQILKHGDLAAAAQSPDVELAEAAAAEGGES